MPRLSPTPHLAAAGPASDTDTDTDADAASDSVPLIVSSASRRALQPARAAPSAGRGDARPVVSALRRFWAARHRRPTPALLALVAVAILVAGAPLPLYIVNVHCSSARTAPPTQVLAFSSPSPTAHPGQQQLHPAPRQHQQRTDLPLPGAERNPQWQQQPQAPQQSQQVLLLASPPPAALAGLYKPQQLTITPADNLLWGLPAFNTTTAAATLASSAECYAVAAAPSSLPLVHGAAFTYTRSWDANLLPGSLPAWSLKYSDARILYNSFSQHLAAGAAWHISSHITNSNCVAVLLVVRSMATLGRVAAQIWEISLGNPSLYPDNQFLALVGHIRRREHRNILYWAVQPRGSSSANISLMAQARDTYAFMVLSTQNSYIPASTSGTFDFTVEPVDVDLSSSSPLVRQDPDCTAAIRQSRGAPIPPGARQPAQSYLLVVPAPVATSGEHSLLMIESIYPLHAERLAVLLIFAAVLLGTFVYFLIILLSLLSGLSAPPMPGTTPTNHLHPSAVSPLSATAINQYEPNESNDDSDDDDDDELLVIPAIPQSPARDRELLPVLSTPSPTLPEPPHPTQATYSWPPTGEWRPAAPWNASLTVGAIAFWSALSIVFATAGAAILAVNTSPTYTGFLAAASCPSYLLLLLACTPGLVNLRWVVVLACPALLLVNMLLLLEAFNVLFLWPTADPTPLWLVYQDPDVRQFFKWTAVGNMCLWLAVPFALSLATRNVAAWDAYMATLPPVLQRLLVLRMRFLVPTIGWEFALSFLGTWAFLLTQAAIWAMLYEAPEYKRFADRSIAAIEDPVGYVVFRASFLQAAFFLARLGVAFRSQPRRQDFCSLPLIVRDFASRRMAVTFSILLLLCVLTAVLFGGLLGVWYHWGASFAGGIGIGILVVGRVVVRAPTLPRVCGCTSTTTRQRKLLFAFFPASQHEQDELWQTQDFEAHRRMFVLRDVWLALLTVIFGPAIVLHRDDGLRQILDVDERVHEHPLAAYFINHQTRLLSGMPTTCTHCNTEKLRFVYACMSCLKGFCQDCFETLKDAGVSHLRITLHKPETVLGSGSFGVVVLGYFAFDIGSGHGHERRLSHSSASGSLSPPAPAALEAGTTRRSRAPPARSQKQVAVKLITLKSPYAMRVAQHEIDVLTSLHHPNLVEVIFSEQHPEFYCIALELCHMNLDRAVRSGVLDAASQGVDVCRQMARGLAYLHRENVVHRDLKPTNVLLQLHDAAWMVKITDFGLSKLEADAGLGGSTLLPHGGTFDYMAPEVIRAIGPSSPALALTNGSGQAQSVRRTSGAGRAADVFALGLVFHFVLASAKEETEETGAEQDGEASDEDEEDHPVRPGRHPFGDTFILRIHNLSASQYQPQLEAGLLAGSVGLITAMLAFEPDRRPTVAEVLGDPFFNRLEALHNLFEISEACMVLGELLKQKDMDPALRALKGDATRVRQAFQQLGAEFHVWAPGDEEGWMAQIDSALMREVNFNMALAQKGRRAGYDKDDFEALVRMIRNLYHHTAMFDPGVLRQCGIVSDEGRRCDEGFYSYFGRRFPALFQAIQAFDDRSGSEVRMLRDRFFAGRPPIPSNVADAQKTAEMDVWMGERIEGLRVVAFSDNPAAVRFEWTLVDKKKKSSVQLGWTAGAAAGAVSCEVESNCPVIDSGSPELQTLLRPEQQPLLLQCTALNTHTDKRSKPWEVAQLRVFVGMELKGLLVAALWGALGASANGVMATPRVLARRDEAPILAAVEAAMAGGEGGAAAEAGVGPVVAFVAEIDGLGGEMAGGADRAKGRKDGRALSLRATGCLDSSLVRLAMAGDSDKDQKATSKKGIMFKQIPPSAVSPGEREDKGIDCLAVLRGMGAGADRERPVMVLCRQAALEARASLPAAEAEAAARNTLVVFAAGSSSGSPTKSKSH